MYLSATQLQITPWLWKHNLQRSVLHCSLLSRWICTWWKAPAQMNKLPFWAGAALSVAGRSASWSFILPVSLARVGIRIAYDKNTGYSFAEVSSSHYLPVGSSGFYLQFSQETWTFSYGWCFKNPSCLLATWIGFLCPTDRFLVLLKDVLLSTQEQIAQRYTSWFNEISRINW